MEHYQRASVIEEDVFLKDNLPPFNLDIPNNQLLPTDFIHLKIPPGVIFQSLLNHSIGKFRNPKNKCIVMSAYGVNSCSMANSCANILSKKFSIEDGGIRIVSSRRVEEIWEPKTDTRLDKLKVTREWPAMHILLLRS